MDKRDFMRKILQKEGEIEEESLMTKEEIYGDSDQNNGPLAETESTFPHNQYPQVRQRVTVPPGGPYCSGLQMVLVVHYFSKNFKYNYVRCLNTKDVTDFIAFQWYIVSGNSDKSIYQTLLILIFEI